MCQKSKYSHPHPIATSLNNKYVETPYNTNQMKWLKISWLIISKIPTLSTYSNHLLSNWDKSLSDTNKKVKKQLSGLESSKWNVVLAEVATKCEINDKKQLNEPV